MENQLRYCLKEIDKKMEEEFIARRIGKTDVCYLGLIQDEASLSNVSTIVKLIDKFSSLKSQVMEYKQGRSIILDMLYELYYEVKMKYRSPEFVMEQIQDHLALAKKQNEPPFGKIRTEFLEIKKELNEKIQFLIRNNEEAISLANSKSLYYNLYIQSYWLSYNVTDLNFKEVSKKLAIEMNNLMYSSLQEDISFRKYQLIQKYMSREHLITFQREGASIPPKESDFYRFNSDEYFSFSALPFSKNGPIMTGNKKLANLENNSESLMTFGENKNENVPLIGNNSNSIPKTYYTQQEASLVLKMVQGIQAQDSEKILEKFNKFMQLISLEKHEQIGAQFDSISKYNPEIYMLTLACKQLHRNRKIIPRTVQILSCLLFLFKAENKGRILQINTGEGKSITVALVAATLALLKKKVDVYTSNKELAKRDCEEFIEFYKDLGLSAGSVGTEEARSSEPNQTYLKDIVYGDVGSFAADLLGDQYEMRGTRCGRQFEYAIVDEVDSMLIDQHNHSTSLAKSIPGLSRLNKILWLIWFKITQMKGTYLNEKFYLSKDGKVHCNAQQYISVYTKDIISRGIIAEQIDLSIPMHTKAFAMTQIDEWVKNGFYALELKRNKEYKIEDDKIIPIDYDNTGIAQTNTQWRGGLHQFVQMKENITVTPMSMTVNFVSNIYMFLLYKSSLIGLTGTLGTQKSIDILEQFYSVDTLKVPPFKPKQLNILEPIVLSSPEQFAIQVIAEVETKKQEGRPCLIICESELSGMKLSKLLEKAFPNTNVIQYYSGNSSIEKNSLNKFCIIISTNLAGRGTDIKLEDSIIQKGGLHVIVAFTPKNKRVEDQAFGRAGRQGQRGSARMMIDGTTDTFIIKNKIFGSLISERDKIDGKICDEQLKNMKDISKMDEVFWDFCAMLNSCQQIQEKNFLRKQEEELWATFYCKIQAMKNEPEKVKSEYADYKRQFLIRIRESNISNPTYLINEGVSLLQANMFEEAFELSEKILMKLPNHIPANYLSSISLAMQSQYSKAISCIEKCKQQFHVPDPMNQALQIIQLQSMSFIQEEYNEDLFLQSLMHDKELTQSTQAFGEHKKHSSKEVFKQITMNGCYKRIKDEEIIKGKLFEQMCRVQTDILKLTQNNDCQPKLSFTHLNDFFKDDKISPQVLREFSSEQISFVIDFKESVPMLWKSLFPLTCGIFQVANSLFLLQSQPEQGNYYERSKDETINMRLIEQQDQGVSIIANTIKRISGISGEQLKQKLKKRSLILIEKIRQFKIPIDDMKLVIFTNEKSAELAEEMLKNIQDKEILTEKIIKQSPDIVKIATAMIKNTSFKLNVEVCQKYQEICEKLLERQLFSAIFANRIDLIFQIQAKFRKLFLFFSFSQFSSEIVEKIVSGVASESMEEMVQKLDTFVANKQKNELVQNKFHQFIINLISPIFVQQAEKILNDLHNNVVDIIISSTLNLSKQYIRKFKKETKDQLGQQKKMIDMQSEQKLKQKNDEKIQQLQKYQQILKEDKSVCICVLGQTQKALQNLSYVDKFGKVLPQFNAQLLKSELVDISSQQNQILRQNKELAQLIAEAIIILIEKSKQQKKKSVDPATVLIKGIFDKILTPLFKSSMHVFHNEIEYVAICGLFKHIINLD